MTTVDQAPRAEQASHSDDRRFYRAVLALVAPLPMLAMGTTYLVLDMAGDAPFRDTVDAAGRQSSTLNATLWLSMLWFAFLIPAVIAVALVTRRTFPRLTAWGLVLTVPGFGLGFAGPNDNVLALLTHEKNLDVGQMTTLDKALWAEPVYGISSLLFIIGIVIGLLLLGIALARSGAAPRAFGIALAAGGFTHPFLGAVNHVVQGAGLYVAAIGFAGASLALLRMSDDEFATR
jgi:hypothetical protein